MWAIRKPAPQEIHPVQYKEVFCQKQPHRNYFFKSSVKIKFLKKQGDFTTLSFFLSQLIPWPMKKLHPLPMQAT